MSLLAQRLLAIHAALDAASVPHAFGGAIALAYCTHNPRGTSDLDINVFLPTEEAPRLAKALPPGITATAADWRDLARQGQARLWWENTPVDVFLNVDTFHESVAATEARLVPFAGRSIPVLSCRALAVFKAMFDRPRDWVDLGEMVDAGAIEPDEIAADVRAILGPDRRVDQLLKLGSPTPSG